MMDLLNINTEKLEKLDLYLSLNKKEVAKVFSKHISEYVVYNIKIRSFSIFEVLSNLLSRIFLF